MTVYNMKVTLQTPLSMVFTFMLSTFFPFILLCPAIAMLSHPGVSEAGVTLNASAQEILDRAITAVGGMSQLGNLTTLSSEAQ